MKVSSLDRLYLKLDKHIKLVEAYTEIKNLNFIIKTCRLKPYDYIFGKRSKIVKLHKLWFDEFGNSFLINKKKKIDIIYNDLALDRKQIIGTDLYYGLSLSQVAKMSQTIHLIAGRDEDLYQECYLLTFLGIDNYLRSYLYYYGEWQQVSPLIMGIRNLKSLTKHRDIGNFKQFKIKEKSPIGCVGGQTWISSVPASYDFLKLIETKYEMLIPVFE